jgi:enoyl-CoA hydratase/carnithine racemase
VAEFVRLEVADAVATMRLDRPKLNPLDAAMQEEIRAAAHEAAERDDVRAVVIYGGPRAFAAGADIKEMADMSYADMARHSGRLQSAFTAVASIPKPVVAAITGYALGGGCELALCADRRIAADDARIGQPEITLGIIPGAGGTQRLSRLVGPSKAKDLVFTGRHVDAAEALRIGLVDDVVAADAVYDTALEWAGQFADGPAYALRAAKEAIDHGLGVDLDTGLEIERTQFAGLFATEDRAIGMRAFLDKAKPAFEGR